VSILFVDSSGQKTKLIFKAGKGISASTAQEANQRNLLEGKGNKKLEEYSLQAIAVFT
jgi:hypothetical protein